MAPIGIPSGVRVVLKEIDLALDSFFVEALLRTTDQIGQNPLTSFVMSNDVENPIAFRCGVFRMAAYVEVETRSIRQKDVGGPPPGHHSTEQIASDLVWTQPSLAAKRKRDSVFIFNSEDATVHKVDRSSSLCRKRVRRT